MVQSGGIGTGRAMITDKWLQWYVKEYKAYLGDDKVEFVWDKYARYPETNRPHIKGVYGTWVLDYDSPCLDCEDGCCSDMQDVIKMEGELLVRGIERILNEKLGG